MSNNESESRRAAELMESLKDEPHDRAISDKLEHVGKMIEEGTGGKCGICGHSPTYVRGVLVHVPH